MKTLLVQSCSKRKVETRRPVPAFERYDGYFYRIIKNAVDGSLSDAPFDLRILSAEHGLLHPAETIEYYDREMDAERAAELRPAVVTELRTLVGESEYDHIVVNTGKAYEAALAGFQEGLEIDVIRIEGRGLGEKGHHLKELLQVLAEDSTIAQAH